MPENYYFTIYIILCAQSISQICTPKYIFSYSIHIIVSITDTYILKYMLSNLYYQIQIPIQIYNLYSHIFSSCVPCLYPHIYISIPKSKYQFFILTFFSSCVPCLYPYVYILIPKTKYQINILTFFSSYQNPNLKLIF